MRTRQYFDYIDHAGKRRTFLIMPAEHRECLGYMTDLNWSVEQCFERITGRNDCSSIILTQDITTNGSPMEYFCAQRELLSNS